MKHKLVESNDGEQKIDINENTANLNMNKNTSTNNEKTKGVTKNCRLLDLEAVMDYYEKRDLFDQEIFKGKLDGIAEDYVKTNNYRDEVEEKDDYKDDSNDESNNKEEIEHIQDDFEPETKVVEEQRPKRATKRSAGSFASQSKVPSKKTNSAGKKNTKVKSCTSSINEDKQCAVHERKMRSHCTNLSLSKKNENIEIPTTSSNAVHDSGINPSSKHNCGRCGKSFYSGRYLRDHIKNVHEGKKSFSCKDCKKRFSQEGAVKKHIESVHEKKRNFQCSHCKINLSAKDSLAKHISVVHEKMKPFCCDTCNKNFGAKLQLKRHNITHHQA